MSASVDVSFDEGVSAPVPKTAIASIARAVLAGERVGRACLLSVSVVGDGHMRALNAQWRGVDAVTDVLSLECERPDDPDLAAGEPCELGDVILAPAYISRQAARVATDEADEFSLLLIHGILHLLGYDHLDDAQAAVMEAREDELLAALAHSGATHVTTTRHDGEGAP